MMTTWVLIFIIILFYLLNTIKPAKFPPGPPHLLPYFGYLPVIQFTSFHKLMKSLSSYYGPIMGFFLPSFTLVVLNDYEHVKEALMNEDIDGRAKIHLFESMKWFRDIGILFSDGSNWQTQKRFMVSHFRKLGFGKISHQNVIMEEVAEINKFIAEQNGKPFNLRNIFFLSFMNILWVSMGGSVFSTKDKKTRELIAQIENMFRLGSLFGHICVTLPFLLPFYSLRKKSSYNQIIDGGICVRNFIMESIEEHKNTLVEEDTRDFIDSYLVEMKKQPANFSEDQLAIILMETFIAATDTSANLESFCILFMCLYPELQEKAQAELDREVGPGRHPTVKDKANLHFLNAFYHEVLRFRTTAPTTIPHLAIRDTFIKGYHIPKGCLIIPNLYAVFMDEKFWGDPEVFRPARFLSAEGNFSPQERLIPFGKGKRSCPGESLARMSTFLILGGLVHDYKFKFSSKPPKNCSGELGFTLEPPQFDVIALPRH